MTEQKPLEEGWYWARPSADWATDTYWRPVRFCLGLVHDYSYVPLCPEDWEFGPRLTPPQEKE